MFGDEGLNRCPTQQRSRILIVDDQEFNIKALKILLTYKAKVDPRSVTIDSANSGRQALEIIE